MTDAAVLTKRDRAIAAAAELARYDGPPAVTTVAVTKRLGITQSAIYRHVRDIDELRSLASRRLVEELDEDLAALVRETGGWHVEGDIDAFLAKLVASLARHAEAFRLIDRWRYDDSELGAGIRTVMLRGRDGIAGMLDAEWIRTRQPDQPMTAAQRSMLLAHAQLVQDDIIGVARLARSGRFPGGRAALVQVLRARVVAGWSAFESCMTTT